MLTDQGQVFLIVQAKYRSERAGLSSRASGASQPANVLCGRPRTPGLHTNTAPASGQKTCSSGPSMPATWPVKKFTVPMKSASTDLKSSPRRRTLFGLRVSTETQAEDQMALGSMGAH